VDLFKTWNISAAEKEQDGIYDGQTVKTDKEPLTGRRLASPFYPIAPENSFNLYLEMI
jgi:hypothetical protein